MKRRKAKWLDSEPLLRGLSDSEAAGTFGVDESQVRRWRRDGLDVFTADLCACLIGKHPLQVWSAEEWDSAEEADPVVETEYETVIRPERWGHRVEQCTCPSRMGIWYTENGASWHLTKGDLEQVVQVYAGKQRASGRIEVKRIYRLGDCINVDGRDLWDDFAEDYEWDEECPLENILVEANERVGTTTDGKQAVYEVDGKPGWVVFVDLE